MATGAGLTVIPQLPSDDSDTLNSGAEATQVQTHTVGSFMRSLSSLIAWQLLTNVAFTMKLSWTPDVLASKIEEVRHTWPSSLRCSPKPTEVVAHDLEANPMEFEAFWDWCPNHECSA
jgi:hypothetical protein